MARREQGAGGRLGRCARNGTLGLMLSMGMLGGGLALAAEPAPEGAAVAARFPDPAVRYLTPVFEPGRDTFTSNAELRALMQQLARDSQLAPVGGVRISLRWLGTSQTGVPLEALLFARDDTAAPGSISVPASALPSDASLDRAPRPTVLLIGQQHGDEPASAEALIVIAQELAHGRLQALLDRIDVIVLPRANPDGAAAGQRFTASGVDMDRDHLLLRTPEAQALAQLAREFEPVVFVDAREYPVPGHFVEKFAALPRADAQFQYAMTANLSEFIGRASQEWFREPVLRALRAQHLSTDWHHTTSIDLADLKVSMGEVAPASGRNVHGLRNAVSLLVETRGAGLGRAHLLRRVHTQVTAITSVLNSAAEHAADLRKLRRFVDAEVAAKACLGEVIVEAAATRGEYDLLMLDATSGADKRVTVTWESALELVPMTRRARPCGYWLGAGQADAVRHLRELGVQVQRIEEASVLRAEAYTRKSRGETEVPDHLSDAAGLLRLSVGLKAALVDADVGSYYVGLDQPLAHLIVVALEPDTRSSWVANRIVTDLSALARVTQRPDAPMTTLP